MNIVVERRNTRKGVQMSKTFILIWIVLVTLYSVIIDKRIKRLEKAVHIQSIVINDHIIGHKSKYGGEND